MISGENPVFPCERLSAMKLDNTLVQMPEIGGVVLANVVTNYSLAELVVERGLRTCEVYRADEEPLRLEIQRPLFRQSFADQKYFETTGVERRPVLAGNVDRLRINMSGGLLSSGSWYVANAWVLDAEGIELFTNRIAGQVLGQQALNRRGWRKTAMPRRVRED
jgi:hypothetical protein